MENAGRSCRNQLPDTAALRKRVEWLDVAKGMAMIFVVIGHCVDYGTPLRIFTYSFHMPMFYMLSGYTMRPPKDGADLWKSTKKDIKSIVLPCLVVAVLRIVLSMIKNGTGLAESLSMLGTRLLWASAYDADRTYLGMLWFLVVLFWSKLLFRVLFLLWPTWKNGLIFAAVAFFGYQISKAEYIPETWNSGLPQSWDVCMVVAFLLYIGWAVHHFKDQLREIAMPVVFVCLYVWIACLRWGLYIELGTRKYSQFPMSLIEACCGTAVMCFLAWFIARSRPATAVLSAIGKNSLMIYIVHALDSYVSFLYEDCLLVPQILIRIAIVLAGGAALVWIQKGWKKLLVWRREKSGG